VFGFLRRRLILFQEFINSILALDKNANIVIAGDFNEFVQTRSVFVPLNRLLTEIDESSGLDPAERYTYVYDQNCQQLVRAAGKEWVNLVS
jgi:predicted extracellular nuclease